MDIDAQPNRIVPAPDDRGSFLVVNGNTEQSFVDPDDPLRLEFEYVRRISEVLEESILDRPRSERQRVVHIGGGGLTLPRFVAARRPGTAQIVFEPDAELTQQVRAQLPLTNRSGIKIRPVDGLSGIQTLADASTDALIVDAFDGARVPPELATAEFFVQVARVLRTEGLLLMNLTDTAPFAWTRRCVAGIVAEAAQVAVIAEIPVWKGRRFGNLVVVAGDGIPSAALERRLARADFPHRLVGGKDLIRWLGGASAFTQADAEPSPEPNWGRSWFA